VAADSNFLVPGGFAAFFVIWFVLVLVGFGGLVLGVAALINVATTPIERFGPWWDNTRQVWLIGIAVSFVLPLGPVIAGFVWFTTGRRGLRDSGVAGRPFWAGAPKPPPPPPPPGWGAPPPAWNAPPPAGPPPGV
jgi:hypothetical protein